MSSERLSRARPCCGDGWAAGPGGGGGGGGTFHGAVVESVLLAALADANSPTASSTLLPLLSPLLPPPARRLVPDLPVPFPLPDRPLVLEGVDFPSVNAPPADGAGIPVTGDAGGDGISIGVGLPPLPLLLPLRLRGFVLGPFGVLGPLNPGPSAPTLNRTAPLSPCRTARLPNAAPKS